MYRLQNQHNNAVIGRFYPRLGDSSAHHPQLVHPFFVFIGQLFFLMHIFPQHFFFFKQSFPDNIGNNGRHQIIPVFLPALFHLFITPETGFTQSKKPQLTAGKIQKIKKQGITQHDHQSPDKIGFMTLGLRTPEKKRHYCDKTDNPGNLGHRKRGHHAFDRINIKITEENALHVHGGLPEINDVQQH